MKSGFDFPGIAGTDETFCLKFLYFDHKTQRWTAECQIGEKQVVFAGVAGQDEWYIVGQLEVEVPDLLRRHLALITQQAMSDYKELAKYRKAVGEYPPGLIQ